MLVNAVLEEDQDLSSIDSRKTSSRRTSVLQILSIDVQLSSQPWNRGTLRNSTQESDHRPSPELNPNHNNQANGIESETALATLKVISMFFQKAIVMVLASVNSVQFTAPQEYELVFRTSQTLRVSWIPNVPLIDSPEYVLGYCLAESGTDCFSTHTSVRTEYGTVELNINYVFRQNGFFRFCMLLPGLEAQGPALYLGPDFHVVD